MDILVFEYAVGGGFKREINESILCQGHAMFKALCTDLKMGEHHLTALWDDRFQKPSCIDEVIKVSKTDNFLSILKEKIDQFDAVLPIAPETDNELLKITKIIENSSVINLGSDSQAVKQTTDKSVTMRLLENKGFSVPETVKASPKTFEHHIERLGFPIIIKPIDGSACDGLILIKGGNGPSLPQKFLMQKYVDGVAASVSLVADGKTAYPLTLNSQEIFFGKNHTEYIGGLVPLKNIYEKKAFNIAKKAVESISGLRGYVGVDLVISKENIYVIEINPRPTTPIIALPQVLKVNIASLILKTALKEEKPKTSPSRFSFFACMERAKLPAELAEIPPPTQTQKTIGISYSSNYMAMEGLRHKCII